MRDIVIGLMIYILVPIVGLYSFTVLLTKMKRELISDSPDFAYFLIFFVYGGLLLTMLTVLFGNWSGMASIGTFFLMSFAPIIMGTIAYRLKKQRKQSTYHRWAYRLGIYYFLICPIVFLILLYIENN